MIIRARAVVTMNGAPISNGAVAIEGGRITEVGTFAEISAANSGEIVDLGECVLLPGLINAHCHLDYSILRKSIPRPASFAGWIKEINARKVGLRDFNYVESIDLGLAEARRFGTTSIVNLTAFPELLPRVTKTDLRVWWYPELIDVRKELTLEPLAAAMLSTLAERGDPSGGVGLAPHALYTASPGLFRRCDKLARRHNLLLTTHLAESTEEMAMFQTGQGPLYDFIKEIGRPMNDCGESTPFEILSRLVSIDNRWLLAHLNELSDRDLDFISRDPNFNVVHCPRSHDYFGHPEFALLALQRLNVNVCLGTDSLASNTDLSLFAEMRALQQAKPGLSPWTLLEMATVNGARALQAQDSLGKIAPGYRADLIAVPALSKTEDLLDEIVTFAGTVNWMMVGGRKVEFPLN